MNYVLPKEAKTSKKYSSLPDDLKKIADELIGKKFKEVEVAENDFGYHRHNPISSQHDETRYCLRTSYISIDGCFAILRKMDSLSKDRRCLEFHMSCKEFSTLCYSNDGRVHIDNKYGYYRLFGIPVRLSNTTSHVIDLVYNQYGTTF